MNVSSNIIKINKGLILAKPDILNNYMDVTSNNNVYIDIESSNRTNF